MHTVVIGLALLAALVLLGGCAYLQLPEFGGHPEGEGLQRVRRSSHYADGEFRNLIPTPVLTEGHSPLSVIVSNLMHPLDHLRPAQPVPAVKIELKALDKAQDTLVWLGHSSFFVQIAGRRILIDPVLSPFAAPQSFAVQAFDGTNVYTVDDLPEIDLLLITHDHWDHLDYPTVTKLQGKVRQVLVALGVGAHFDRWGFEPGKVREADWYEKLELGDGLAVHLVPARHYSGRGLTRNKTLWTGFVLESGQRRLLFSGDTGYGPHFKEIGQRFGSFDLAALDMGQYDPRWPHIHMTPEEAAQAARDLDARALMPAHVGRFSLARHAWNDPFERIRAASRGRPYRLLTPRIGEALPLDGHEPGFPPWWQETQQAAAAASAPEGQSAEAE
ncbi:MBL fold metallo-hydrolase [Ramlibacter sp. 2FC]|uniref:MBL fold metallo-hydrolase n=1 Tax=Ramlibacter sp. 2FC TaxID=2502188 RepID=UPI00201DE7E5|nr:MBL fold metallo-hydrolase [Ramlibacter sp. 2FC]